MEQLEMKLVLLFPSQMLKGITIPLKTIQSTIFHEKASSQSFNHSNHVDKYLQRPASYPKHGARIPAIGFGTVQDPDEQEMAVLTALTSGYRHIDTAHKFVLTAPFKKETNFTY